MKDNKIDAEKIINEIVSISNKLRELWDSGVLVVDRGGRAFVSSETMKAILKHEHNDIEFAEDGYGDKPYTITVRKDTYSFISMCSQDEFEELKKLIEFVKMKEKITRFVATINELIKLKEELAEYIANEVSFLVDFNVDKDKTKNLEVWFKGGDSSDSGYVIEHAILEAFPELRPFVRSANYIRSFSIYESIRMKLANVKASLEYQK
jgi:TPP-dependent trihydroxycyclohexane-1,2-dione (THcHDO) dehydratase